MLEEMGGVSSSDHNIGLDIGIGSYVRLLKSIYDDGEDHHPPGYIADSGDIVIVKNVLGSVLAVAHEGNDGAFLIYPGEYVLFEEQSN